MGGGRSIRERRACNGCCTGGPAGLGSLEGTGQGTGVYFATADEI